MNGESVQGPRCTADVLCYRFVDKNFQVLFVRRKYEPFKDQWAIPGGFVESDETISQAARRELREETNLTPEHVRQFRAYGGPDRDPRGPVVTICFLAFFHSDETSEQASSDAKSLGWHDPYDPPPLAFDHRRILTESNRYLSDSILHSPVAFRLLPGKFTLDSLFVLYERILQETIDSSAFSERLLDNELITPVNDPNHETSGRAHYRRNKEAMKNYIRNNLPLYP